MSIRLATAGSSPGVPTSSMPLALGRPAACPPSASPTAPHLTPLHPTPTHPHRLVWSAYQPEPWSPQNHHGHAPAFKRAVKALLLTAHRRRPAPAPAQDEPRTRRQRAEMDAAGASCCQACLADLDSLLLLKIVGCAAHPLSAWLGG